MAVLDDFLSKLDTLIVNPLIALLFALAAVFFLYGMVQFIMNAANDEKRTEGKSHMLWGIVGIAIMLSVFALLSLIMNTFGIKGISPKDGTVELQ